MEKSTPYPDVLPWPGVRGRVRLASASPRRLALLRQVGIEPQVCPVAVDESPLPGEEPAALAARLAALKALAGWTAACPGAPLSTGACALGADTIVVLDGEALGKPRDAADARAMLARLAGRAHRVLTGVSVAWDGTTPPATVVVTARVWLRPLGTAEIAAYVATGEPLDKAGGYGIQGHGGALVARLEGSCSAVVGLPLAETLELLRRGPV